MVLKHVKKSIVIFLISIILSAYGGESIEKGSAQESDTKEQVEDSISTEMSKEEVMEIIQGNLSSIEKEMQELNRKYPKWLGFDFMNPSDDTIYNEAMGIVSDVLGEYITEDILEDMTEMYLYHYFTFLKEPEIFSEKVELRFEVIHQKEDYFKAQYIVFGGNHNFPGTVVLTYKKQNNTWKINDYEIIGTDHTPLNLTIEDIQEYYKESEVVLIEETSIDGEDYIVYKYNDIIEARNVKDSIPNYDIVEDYNENTKSEEEDSKEVASDVQEAEQVDEKLVESNNNVRFRKIIS